jgi:hypothetical protein
MAPATTTPTPFLDAAAVAQTVAEVVPTMLTVKQEPASTVKNRDTSSRTAVLVNAPTVATTTLTTPTMRTTDPTIVISTILMTTLSGRMR